MLFHTACSYVSSKIKILEFEYNALAIAILCFCPPLSLEPLSPTKVKKASSIFLITLDNLDALITCINFFLLIIFSFNSNSQIYDPVSWQFSKNKIDNKRYELIFTANIDDKLVAITPAMSEGSGMVEFSEQHPDKFFDVAIAEQHCVNVAAGMACEGLKPVVAIYSTFLQRAFDQVVHDVAIQKLPVRFAIDRAGLVGSDGPTHAGSFDITYLATLPNFIVMAPSNQRELSNMIELSCEINDTPSAFRFPRGTGSDELFNNQPTDINIGKGYILIEGNDVAILNLGTRLEKCIEASKFLNQNNIYPTIADARFAKPLDTELIDNLLNNHKYILTIEEGSIGGFSSHVLHYVHNIRSKKDNVVIKNLIFPDRFVEHMTPDEQYQDIKMDTESIIRKINNFYENKIFDIKNFKSKV